MKDNFRIRLEVFKILMFELVETITSKYASMKNRMTINKTFCHFFFQLIYCI